MGCATARTSDGLCTAQPKKACATFGRRMFIPPLRQGRGRTWGLPEAVMGKLSTNFQYRGICRTMGGTWMAASCSSPEAAADS